MKIYVIKIIKILLLLLNQLDHVNLEFIWTWHLFKAQSLIKKIQMVRWCEEQVLKERTSKGERSVSNLKPSENLAKWNQVAMCM